MLKYYVKVNDAPLTYVIRKAGSDDDWDRDSTDTDHNITGISVVPEEQYYDLVVNFDPTKEDKLYLLYVIYSTGDSFGNDDGRIEYIGLYKDLSLAQKNKDIITNNKESAITLIAENGKRYDMHCPWIGYFESLEDVVIETITC